MTRPGTELWQQRTTPFERVRAVAVAASRPQSAEHIAETALVPAEDTKDHLETLVKKGVLVEQDDEGELVYRPASDYTRSQLVQDLLDTHNRDELIELRDTLQAQIDTWRNEYGVKTLDQLRDRTDTTAPSPESREVSQVIHDWELVEYRLTVITDILDE